MKIWLFLYDWGETLCRNKKGKQTRIRKKVTLDNQAESRDILRRLANSIVQYVVGCCCYSSESAAYFATKKSKAVLFVT